MRLLSAVFFLAALSSQSAWAQFAIEEGDETGTLNPTDFSWRAYMDRLDRFPDRIGLICDSAYYLDKTGDHQAGFAFFQECAKRGNPPSMIYLSTFYDEGKGTAVDHAEATKWLKRAAETGYSLAQYHYGMALLRGQGVTQNVPEGRAWITKAADQQDRDAMALVKSGFKVD